jgi:hypothetical protein
MTDPYRDHVYRCPACAKDTPLREFSGRLLCDSCQGMYVSRADLVQAIEELGGLDVELSYFSEKPGQRACPRCARAMMTCRLRLSFAVIEEQPKTHPRLDRCDADGLWFDANELAEVFETVVHTTGGRGGGGTGRGGSSGPTTILPGAGRGWGFGK